MNLPILYSFRRCPYAMRARLAVVSAGISVELREIVLRDKAPALLAASPKATVPVLVDGQKVIDESLDIMLWALALRDPEGWLNMPAVGFDLIAQFDGPFKLALDHTKYASRYPDMDTRAERRDASEYLMQLNDMLDGQAWLYGAEPRLADMAIIGFVRQFANIDRNWFDAQPWPHLISWLEAYLSSDRFGAIMHKYPKWCAGDPAVGFGGEENQA